MIALLIIMGAGCSSKSTFDSLSNSQSSNKTSVNAANTTEDNTSDDVDPEDLVVKDIDVSINRPVKISKDGTAEFVVTVKNTADYERELVSIDIDQPFLDGVMVTQTIPETSEEYYMEELDQYIFWFNETIPANSSIDVAFSVQGISIGDFSGALDVCVDGAAACVYKSIRMIVE